MVGMSGKSNEPRGGPTGSSQHSKKQLAVTSHSKQVRHMVSSVS